MTVSKKEKGTIVVDGKTYLWWVFDKVDQSPFDDAQIKLISEDQSHYIKYRLEQTDDNRSVVIGLHNNPGHIQLECPKFEDEKGIITLSGIRQLVNWCKAKPDETTIRIIKHAYEPKLHSLSKERIEALYKRILASLNKN